MTKQQLQLKAEHPRLPNGLVLVWSYLLLLLSACTQNPELELNQQLLKTQQQIQGLTELIEQRKLSNIDRIHALKRQLEEKYPEHQLLVNAIVEIADKNSLMLRKLQTRLTELEQSQLATELRISALQDLYKAANGEIYNDALVDVLNVAQQMMQADGELSKGQNPFIAVGHSLIGNPLYGEWLTNDSGLVWQWYGLFALLAQQQPIVYRDWLAQRSYSFNADIKPDIFLTLKEQSTWQQQLIDLSQHPKRSSQGLSSLSKELANNSFLWFRSKKQKFSSPKRYANQIQPI